MTSDDPGAQWVAAMRAGRFAEAWALSERALASRGGIADDPALPYHRRWVWDGRPFDGRDVLVRCYQGLGDTIMFARYLPALAARAASVTVEATPRLAGLLAQLAGVARIVPFDPARPAKPSACDLEITDLGFALRLAPDAVDASYLHAAPAPLPAGTIGLCWRGGDWDPDRSLTPALLAPLCAGRPAVALVAEPTSLPVLNPEGCPFDIDATAALIAGCAVVVTVDTMVAHLAGALGRPTWLMLKAAPDWRWDPASATTPWYPSLRLHAQTRPGDWQAVIDSIASDLPDPSAGRGVPPT